MGFFDDIGNAFKEWELKEKLDDTLASEVNTFILSKGWALVSSESRQFLQKDDAPAQDQGQTRGNQYEGQFDNDLGGNQGGQMDHGHRGHHNRNQQVFIGNQGGGMNIDINYGGGGRRTSIVTSGTSIVVNGPADVSGAQNNDFFQQNNNWNQNQNRNINRNMNNRDRNGNGIDDDMENNGGGPRLNYGNWRLPASAEGAVAVFRFIYDTHDAKRLTVDLYSIASTFSPSEFTFKPHVNNALAGDIAGKDYIKVQNAAIEVFNREGLAEKVAALLGPFAPLDAPKRSAKCPGCGAPAMVNAVTGKGRCEYCDTTIQLDVSRDSRAQTPAPPPAQAPAPQAAATARPSAQQPLQPPRNPLVSQPSADPWGNAGPGPQPQQANASTGARRTTSSDADNSAAGLEQSVNSFVSGVLSNFGMSMAGAGAGAGAGAAGATGANPSSASGACPSCGTAMDASWRACPGCGWQRGRGGTGGSSRPSCLSCGAAVDSGWRVCPACGGRLQ